MPCSSYPLIRIVAHPYVTTLVVLGFVGVVALSVRKVNVRQARPNCHITSLRDRFVRIDLVKTIYHLEQRFVCIHPKGFTKALPVKNIHPDICQRRCYTRPIRGTYQRDHKRKTFRTSRSHSRDRCSPLASVRFLAEDTCKPL